MKSLDFYGEDSLYRGFVYMTNPLFFFKVFHIVQFNSLNF